MKDFFNDYGKVIGRNILNHIAMVIFSVLVIFTTSTMNKVLFHLAGVLAILLHLFLIYVVMWEVGSQDKIKVDGDRLKKNRLTGLNIALISNSPLILLGILVTIFTACVPQGASANAFTSFVGILETIDFFAVSMYSTLISLAPNFNALYLIVLILPIACGALSYLSGLSGMKCLIPDKKKNERK